MVAPLVATAAGSGLQCFNLKSTGELFHSPPLKQNRRSAICRQQRSVVPFKSGFLACGLLPSCRPSGKAIQLRGHQFNPDGTASQRIDGPKVDSASSERLSTLLTFPSLVPQHLQHLDVRCLPGRVGAGGEAENDRAGEHGREQQRVEDQRHLAEDGDHHHQPDPPQHP